MNSDSDSPWSDTDEDEGPERPPLQSRAYQIEMFEESMKGNIIAVVKSKDQPSTLQLSLTHIDGHGQW